MHTAIVVVLLVLPRDEGTQGRCKSSLILGYFGGTLVQAGLEECRLSKDFDTLKDGTRAGIAGGIPT